ncbi:MAG TPA: tetratricopeptide repeat protein [Thermoanaerobaculia bacterium]
MTRLMVSVRAVAIAAILAAGSSGIAQENVSADFEKAVYFGKQFFTMSNHASAYEQFVRADTLVPGHPAVIYNMALLLAKNGRFSESQVQVDRYLQLHPGGVERQLVNQLQLQLEFQRELEKSRRIEQEYTDIFNRGRFLYGRGELEAALKLFVDAEERRPSEPAAVLNQAVVHERLGDFAKAAERYRRYLGLESDPQQKGAIDQHVVALEGEIEDMRTKIVCSYCGHGLQSGATWCHRCWHGPYQTASPVFNSRVCLEGASVTRATFFGGDRFNRNETLSCMFDGPRAEALRYSPSRQSSIQDVRRAEGWTYSGEVLQSWSDREGNEIRYLQGPDFLERIESTSGGEILTYAAHQGPSGWLLDSEAWFIDGQQYDSSFTFDSEGRIAQQTVRYQNATACNHLIRMKADYRWEEDRLAGATLSGEYEGFVSEGSPKTEWQASLTNSYDELGRVVNEDLLVTSFTKTYAARPAKGEREVVSQLYPAMRVKRPLDVSRSGDLCGIAAGRQLSNAIDLRPFYPLSPNFALALPNGVVRATVTHTYPPGYKP